MNFGKTTHPSTKLPSTLILFPTLRKELTTFRPSNEHESWNLLLFIMHVILRYCAGLDTEGKVGELEVELRIVKFSYSYSIFSLGVKAGFADKLWTISAHHECSPLTCSLQQMRNHQRSGWAGVTIWHHINHGCHRSQLPPAVVH